MHIKLEVPSFTQSRVQRGSEPPKFKRWGHRHVTLTTLNCYSKLSKMLLFVENSFRNT